MGVLRRTWREIDWFACQVRQQVRLWIGAPGARVRAAFHFPTDMCDVDRLFLYAFVRGVKPTRAIEIGTRWGGSARIITAAMEDNGVGRLVGLDPAPDAFRVRQSQLYGRFSRVTGYSPQDVPKAVSLLDDQLDFVLIDAIHTSTCAFRDLRAVEPYLMSGAHILCHDAFHPGVRHAIDMFVERFSGRLIDLGLMTRDARGSAPICGQGFRVLRMREDSEDLIRHGYERAGVQYPAEPSRLYEFDRWAIRKGLVKEIDGAFRWMAEGCNDDLA